jgi:hypothetical protein
MPFDEEMRRRYAKFVAKTWADEGFRQRALADPAGALSQFGITIPPGKDVKLIEGDPEKTVPFILPTKPANLASGTNLEQAAFDGIERGPSFCL